MRTIYLLQNKAGQWFVHTKASSGDIVSSEESFSTPHNAQRAFIQEGRNQPFAKMTVVIHGTKPITVRKATPLPPRNVEVEQIQIGMIRAAMKLRHLH